jgi:hypothetical protein
MCQGQAESVRLSRRRTPYARVTRRDQAHPHAASEALGANIQGIRGQSGWRRCSKAVTITHAEAVG